MIKKIILGLFFFGTTLTFSQNLDIAGKVEGPPEVNWTHGFVFLPGKLPLLKDWKTPKSGILDQKDFQYVPLVVALVQGQELKVKNSDFEFHNVHGYGEDGLTRFNVAVLAQMKHSILIEKAEVIDIFCDIHAQMRAYVLCLENPYFARLQVDGSFSLKPLPDQATQLMFWHPYLDSKVVPLEKSPILIQTSWKPGYEPKSKVSNIETVIPSFEEIAQEIGARLEPLFKKRKEEAYAILEDCYFSLYEAGGMETAVRFHLSGRRAFMHEQLFRDIKHAIKSDQLENAKKFQQELCLDLLKAAEEFRELGVLNKSAYSTGAIDLSKKAQGTEHLASMTTRKLVPLFSETEDLLLPEIILQTLYERKRPYLEHFWAQWETFSLKKQIVLLQHLKFYTKDENARKKLESASLSSSWLLRSVALDTLRIFPHTEEIMKKFVQDTSAVVQQKAIHGWVVQASDRCLVVATPFLEDPNADLRLAAIYGLIEVAEQNKNQQEQIQNTLFLLSENPDYRPDIRFEIWKYLGVRCKTQWLQALCEENPTVRENVFQAVVLNNREISLFLRDALSDSDARVRLNALTLLSHIPDHAPILERNARWMQFLSQDSDPTIAKLAKSFVVPFKEVSPIQDLTLFFSAYAQGHLRTAYFLLTQEEQQKQPFSLFAKSYWRNPNLAKLFATPSIDTVSLLEETSAIVSVKIGTQLISFQLKKEKFFWKIDRKF